VDGGYLKPVLDVHSHTDHPAVVDDGGPKVAGALRPAPVEHPSLEAAGLFSKAEQPYALYTLVNIVTPPIWISRS
jgi:hypothetical protein